MLKKLLMPYIKLISNLKKVNLLSKIKILFSFLLLVILLLMADFNALKNVFQKIDLSIFVWLIIIQFFALSLNTYKWKVFIPSLKFNQLLKFNLITFFYNMIVPGQGVGEVVKIYKMRSILPTEEIATSVILERVFSLFTAFIVCGFGLYFSNYQYPEILMHSTVAVILLIILVLWVMKVSSLEFLRGSHYKVFSFKLSDKITGLILKFSNNIRYSLTGFTVNVNVFLGVIAQLLNVSMVMLIGNSIGLDILFVDWCWVFSCIGIALILPISVAGIGVREGLFVMLVFQLGGKIEDGLAISLSLLIIQLFFALIGWLLDFRESNLSKG